MEKISSLVPELKPEERRRPRNAYPRKLSAFCNAKVLGIYKCAACNWPHYGISERDAIAYVSFMNEYTTSLDDQEAADIFGGKILSVEQFRRCFFCASPTSEMVLIENPEKRISVSGRPIIVSLPR